MAVELNEKGVPIRVCRRCNKKSAGFEFGGSFQAGEYTCPECVKAEREKSDMSEVPHG